MAEVEGKGGRTSIFRRLDFLPAWVAIILGVGVGGLAGVLLIESHPVVGALGFVALLALAGSLALSGEPVAIFEEVSQVDISPSDASLQGDALPIDIEPDQPQPAEPYVVRPGWVAIPGGKFLMGSPEAEEGRYSHEGPIHKVRLSPFEIMQYPVTRQACAEILSEDPSWPEGEADQRPVNQASWLDAARFCNRMSKIEGLIECYHIVDKEVSWDRAADGYRLPTEAEWEYACRAGRLTRWSFGDDEAELDRYMWHEDNSDSQSHPVGEKEPNPWELYDMYGNVYEWCWDWFGPYSEDPQEDPIGPDEGSIRVLRGGAFFNSPRGLRSAVRVGNLPENRDGNTGLRCVRSLRSRS